VLKHGPARIELVRVVSCFDKKEAHREEGKFIRELPTCVNIQKNYTNKAEWYEANKQTIHAKQKAYRLAKKETIKEKKKANRLANQDAMIAKDKTYYQTNKDSILAKHAEKITCECGAVICYNHLARHRRTWNHFFNFIHL